LHREIRGDVEKVNMGEGMESVRTSNSALKTVLAFHHQVLIGVDKCFSLKEGQSIWIEKDGDVSLHGGGIGQSIQFEIKDYADSLTDSHENFWKTLKNWLGPDFKHSEYGALVLHTTQPFGKRSQLSNWNALNADERLQVLKNISDKKRKEDGSDDSLSQVDRLQNYVMGVGEDILLSVLEKVSIFTEVDKLNELRESIINRQWGIPKNNRNSYLDGIVGFVYGRSNENSWVISFSEFKCKCEELTSVFCKREFTFPIFEGYSASLSEVEDYQERPFVLKIKEIDHDSVIQSAVGNWIEFQNSLSQDLDGFPQYKANTIRYQKNIIEKIKLRQFTERDDLPSNCDRSVINRSSRKVYNEIISENPLPMENYTPPMEYKNGLIHAAMDDSDDNLKWVL